jgi:hypothetical protein
LKDGFPYESVDGIFILELSIRHLKNSFESKYPTGLEKYSGA